MLGTYCIINTVLTTWVVMNGENAISGPLLELYNHAIKGNLEIILCFEEVAFFKVNWATFWRCSKVWIMHSRSLLINARISAYSRSQGRPIIRTNDSSRHRLKFNDDSPTEKLLIRAHLFCNFWTYKVPNWNFSIFCESI